MAKNREAVVKIDSDLLKQVEEFINQKENRITYPNKKQFVNIAVMEKLAKETKSKKRGER